MVSVKSEGKGNTIFLSKFAFSGLCEPPCLRSGNRRNAAGLTSGRQLTASCRVKPLERATASSSLISLHIIAICRLSSKLSGPEPFPTPKWPISASSKSRRKHGAQLGGTSSVSHVAYLDDAHGKDVHAHPTEIITLVAQVVFGDGIGVKQGYNDFRL